MLKAQNKKFLSTKSLRLTRKLFCWKNLRSTHKLFAAKKVAFKREKFRCRKDENKHLCDIFSFCQLINIEVVVDLEINFKSCRKSSFFENFSFLMRLNYLSLRVERKLICAWGANFFCSKMFLFELSARSFIAFDDYPLRDKLDLFLLEVSTMNFTAQIFWASSTNVFGSCIQNFALKIIFVWASSANTFLPNLRVKRRSPLRLKFLIHLHSNYISHMM